MSKKKPRQLSLCSYGTELIVKMDPKMSNIWILNIPLSYGKAKQLHVWLTAYLKYMNKHFEESNDQQ